MSVELPAYVLDSCAALAYLGGEPGMARVQALPGDVMRHRCCRAMSVINLGEVLTIAEREVGLVRAQAALAAIEQLPIDILPATRETVLAAAHIKVNFRLAYADAFAVAVAQDLGGTVVTGDPEFEELEGLVGVEWLDSQ